MRQRVFPKRPSIRKFILRRFLKIGIIKFNNNYADFVNRYFWANAHVKELRLATENFSRFSAGKTESYCKIAFDILRKKRGSMIRLIERNMGKEVEGIFDDVVRFKDGKEYRIIR